MQRIMNNIAQTALFFILAGVVLLGIHFFLYVSVVHFFALSNVFYKYLLGTLLAFLSVSFIFSSLAAHFYENILTRSAYFLSGLWLGLLVNLVLAALVGWLVIWGGRFLGFAQDKTLFGLIFFGIAVVISAYGVYNALHPVVKHVSVHIPGIPDEWKGKTIVQLSDMHLGHVYQSGFLKNVVAEVNALHPKMVVITGDLFDGMDGHLDSLVQPFGDINAPSGVFFVTGNHETYLGVETALGALKNTNVIIMKDEVRDIDGLQLIGINFPYLGEQKNVLTTLESLRDQYSGKPNILLYHAPVAIEDVAKSGVNLMLSGHTHQGQQFPFQFITHMVHKGHDYGLYSLGDFTLYTTSGVGTWGPTMRIGTQSEIVAITIE